MTALFWAQFFGALNDNIFKNALIILITFKAATVMGVPASQMAVVCGGVFILPYFIFSATSGQLADKFEKSRIIRIVRFIEIPLMILATLGFHYHHYELLLIVLFVIGTHSTVFGPVKYSIIPQIVPPEQLIKSNALVGAGTFIAILLGTITGGVLIAVEPNGPLIVSAVLTLVAIAGWVAALYVPRTRAAAPDLKVQLNPFPPTMAIIRFTRANRTLMLAVLGISWFWFFGAGFLSLFAPLCKDVLKTNEGVVTTFLATFSIGIATGSMLCGRLSKGRVELGLVPFGSIGMTIFVLDLAWSIHKFSQSIPAHEGLMNLVTFVSAPGGLRILADLLLVSIAGGFYIVPLMTLIQERCPDEYRSRIVASNNILNALFMVSTSVMLVALMIAGLSLAQIFAVLGVLNALVATYIYLVMPEFYLRFLSWLLANAMYRLKVRGAENIPSEGGAVLVCNHVSFVDWLIIFGAIKRPVRFVMDHSYAPGWIGRFMVNYAKVIPIATSKEDPEKLRLAMERVAEELRDGNVVCIFPEGVITRSGELGDFKRGVERIIATTPVPVVPMALQGLWGSFFSRANGPAMSSRPRRFWSRIALAIGEPQASHEVTATSLQIRVSELRGEWK